jgi:hypothetical protein
MSRCKLSFAKSRFVVDPARRRSRLRGGAGRELPKSRGITAKERYLREAYIEVRCSDEG